MKNHFLSNPILRIAAALLLVITLSLTTAPPALALDLNPADYFEITFNQVGFDKSEAAAGEAFRITITGRAACIKDLPLPISEITITSQVIARPASGGTALTLNPQYVINIKPLPNKAGQTFDINQSVTLQFPAGAAPGSYSVIGLLTEAKVKVVLWLDVTSSFPTEQAMGAVKCIVRAPAATAGTTTAPPTTAITPAATTTAAATATNPNKITDLPSPIDKFPATTIIIIGLLAVIAVLLIIILVMVMRRRGI